MTMARPRALVLRRSWIAAVAAVAVTTFVAWFVGFDALWALAIGLSMAVVGAVFAQPGSEEDDAWEPIAQEVTRGIRSDIVALTDSLAACDRLARPEALRSARALLIPEGGDRLSGAIAERRMRALLATELHSRGLDPDDRSTHEVIAGLLGPDALTILHPKERGPITSAAIARCLDAIAHLNTETRGEP